MPKPCPWKKILLAGLIPLVILGIATGTNSSFKLKLLLWRAHRYELACSWQKALAEYQKILQHDPQKVWVREKVEWLKWNLAREKVIDDVCTHREEELKKLANNH